MRSSICLFILLTLFINIKGEEWRGIKPLYSTRTDVERILGQSSDANGRVYKLENESAFISYSDGICSQKSKDWDVPKDTVLTISVSSGLTLFSELKVDETKFVKKLEHLPDVFYYTNSEDGIMYVVDNHYITDVL